MRTCKYNGLACFLGNNNGYGIRRIKLHLPMNPDRQSQLGNSRRGHTYKTVNGSSSCDRFLEIYLVPRAFEKNNRMNHPHSLALTNRNSPINIHQISSHLHTMYCLDRLIRILSSDRAVVFSARNNPNPYSSYGDSNPKWDFSPYSA